MAEPLQTGGHDLNKLGRGLLGDATCQISKVMLHAKYQSSGPYGFRRFS